MSLEDDLEKAKFDLEQIQNEMSKYDDDPILQEIQRLQKELAEKRDLLRETRQKAAPIRRQLNDQLKIVESVERQVNVEREAQEIAREIERISVRLDEITRDAKWRGHLLTHQLDGAHMLATSRRAILCRLDGHW